MLKLYHEKILKNRTNFFVLNLRSHRQVNFANLLEILTVNISCGNSDKASYFFREP